MQVCSATDNTNYAHRASGLAPCYTARETHSPVEWRVKVKSGQLETPPGAGECLGRHTLCGLRRCGRECRGVWWAGRWGHHFWGQKAQKLTMRSSAAVRSEVVTGLGAICPFFSFWKRRSGGLPLHPLIKAKSADRNNRRTTIIVFFKYKIVDTSHCFPIAVSFFSTLSLSQTEFELMSFYCIQ